MARAALACGGGIAGDDDDGGGADASRQEAGSREADARAAPDGDPPDASTPDVLDATLTDAAAVDATDEDAASPVDSSDGGARRDADALDGGPSDADARDGRPADAGPEATRCADGGTPTMYLWSSIGELHRFDPLAAAATSLGFPCGPNQGGPYGLQMTAAADGYLYVLFSDATMRQVVPGAASCTQPPFDGTQQGFVKNTFAIAAANDGQIYVADHVRLGVMTAPTFQVSDVGPLQPSLPVNGLDLATDAWGRLFAYSISLDAGTYVTEIDRATGARGGDTAFALGPGGAWAFTRWEGDFYLFVAQPSSAAWRFTPGAPGPVKVADLPFDVFGAAAERCLP
jgi:hypothetical protein